MGMLNRYIITFRYPYFFEFLEDREKVRLFYPLIELYALLKFTLQLPQHDQSESHLMN